MSAPDTTLPVASMTPGAWLGRAAAILTLIAFALFFVTPLVWLLIAPTKTDRQLLLDAPFALGDWATLAANWATLISFQKGLLWTWLTNSAFYCGAALIITLVVIPAADRLAVGRELSAPEARLLYVAMTRATRELLLCGVAAPTTLAPQ